MSAPARPHRIDVIVNGQSARVEAGSLGTVLRMLGHDLTHAAVALNEEVVFRRDLETTTVAAGDRIEVLSPMSGG